ncbi:MAG: DUF4157 domain-containing protein [Nitriliruptoraceae bacterium]
MGTWQHAPGAARRREEQGARRASVTPSSTAGSDAAGLVALQRTAGNRAVTELVQTKLQVGAVDDPLEAEADRVARQVVAGLQHADDATAPPAASLSRATTVRRRAAAGPGGVTGGELDAGTDAAIRRSAGGGQPLEPTVQRSMEAGFGSDLSAVRVHLDADADGLNRQLGARAFTTGSDIFFRQGEYDPSSSSGQELLAHELAHVVQQGAVGRTPQVARTAETETVQRKAYEIGSTGEKLEVGFLTSRKERKALVAEAERIISDLQTTYGVVVSSSTTIEGIKDGYTNVSQEVLDSLSTRPWRIKELRALSRALSHYAAILGANRATSTRAGEDQEVTSVGKVTQAIDVNRPAGQLDTTTLGEYFSSRKNMGLFRASERFKADFDNVEDQLTGTFVHEIAHGLLAYALRDYIAATGYWKDRYSELPAPHRTENPVTEYGRTNASEDLCESAMMYFVAPERLKRACPLRYAFMHKLGTDWVPAPAQAPQVQPDAPGVAPEVVATEPQTVPPEVVEAEERVQQVLRQVSEPAPEEATEDHEPTEGGGWRSATPDTDRGAALLGAGRSGPTT